MGFLAPLFLAGLAAIALPIWLHRLQTQSSERQPFGSAMLLETTEQRVHVRRKLKYLPLLALRIALLCLLAFAFAKPFLNDDALAGAVAEAGTHLVVIDTSASMLRDGAMNEAEALARDALDAAPGGAVLQLLTAATTLRPVTEASADPVLQRNAFSSTAAGGTRLDFGELSAAIDDLAEELPPPVTLHLVSDFQQSAMPAKFADLGLSNIARFVPHPVVVESGDNARVESLRERAGTVDVTVANADASELRVLLNGEPVVVAGAANASAADDGSLRIDNVAGIEGDNALEARLDIDDGYAPDNSRFAVFTRGNRQPVPVITNDTGALPYTYLSAALDAGSESAFRAEPMLANDFDPRVLSRYRFAIVDDIGGISDSLAAPLRKWVEQGGALLTFAGRRAAGRVSLPVTGHGIAPSQTTAGGAVKVGRLDEKHPLLASTDGWFTPEFADALPIELNADDEVLVALENGTPLIVEAPLGQGRVLLVTAGLDNVANDLPTRPVFVGFMFESGRYLSGTSGIVRNFVAGERLTLPPGGGQVLDPAGDALLSLQGTAAAQSVQLAEPGIYTVLSPGLEYRVAVNSDPREARFEAVDDTVLADWAALAAGTSAAVAGGISAAPPGVIELWPWALLLLVVLIIGESLLGNLLLAPVSNTRQGARA